MDEVKTVVSSVFVFCLLSVLQLMPGIRSQSTIVGSSSEHEFYSTLDDGIQSVEHMRSVLESDRHRKKTLENVSYAQEEEIQQLTMDLEKEQRRLRTRDSSVTATLIHNLRTSRHHGGITRVEERFYLLAGHPEAIIVFEERNKNFSIVQQITLNETHYSYNIAYSNRSKRVYLNDPTNDCIWAMTTTNGHRITKWLAGVPWIVGLAFSNEGHLLVLRYKPSSQLETYSLNATLIRRLQFSPDIEDPKDVVQTPGGNFILLHRLKPSWQWVISEMTIEGQLVNRFIPRNQCEEFSGPRFMYLDADNNRLFVADQFDGRVTLFDSVFLTFTQVLVSKETNGIDNCYALAYDENNKYLFVAGGYGSVAVLEIN